MKPCPARADEERTPLRWRDISSMGLPRANGWRIAATVGRDVKLSVLPDSWKPSLVSVADLWLYGSGWDRERVHRASAALVARIG